MYYSKFRIGVITLRYPLHKKADQFLLPNLSSVRKWVFCPEYYTLFQSLLWVLKYAKQANHIAFSIEYFLFAWLAVITTIVFEGGV